MAKFCKKPVVIDAIEWCGGDYSCLNAFCGRNWARADTVDAAWTREDDGEKVMLWNTAEEQWLMCPKGWWVIRGVEGEVYPCAPHIFTATYEAVDVDETR